MSAQMVKGNKNAATEARESARPARRSFDRSGPLSFGGCPPDKIMRVVNDEGNNIHIAQQLGYQFVNSSWVSTDEKTLNTVSDMGTAKKVPVDFDHRTRTAIMGYLMMIDRDQYEANQKYDQDQLDERQNNWMQSQLNTLPGAYIPK